jgi:hypothetical protein
MPIISHHDAVVDAAVAYARVGPTWFIGKNKHSQLPAGYGYGYGLCTAERRMALLQYCWQRGSEWEELEANRIDRNRSWTVTWINFP